MRPLRDVAGEFSSFDRFSISPKSLVWLGLAALLSLDYRVSDIDCRAQTLVGDCVLAIDAVFTGFGLLLFSRNASSCDRTRMILIQTVVDFHNGAQIFRFEAP